MKKGFSYPDSPTSAEEVFGKSETIPNQALNIREIMMRSLRGALLPEVQNNNLEYGEDEDFEDGFDPEVDLTDIDENNERLSYLEQRVKQQKDAQAKPKHQDSQKPDGEELPPPNEEKVD